MAVDAQAGLSGPTPNLIVRILSPRSHFQAFGELSSLLIRQRSVTWEMAKREVTTEHAGKHFGRLWGIFQPLLLLSVYAIVYGIVFHARVGGTQELPRNFTIYLLAGLVPWFAFQLCMTKAASVIPANAAFVKQVVFDINVLPFATALFGCLPLVLGLGFIAVYTLVDYGTVPLLYIALPAVIVIQLLAMAGVAFALAASGAFVRDVRDVVQLSSIVLIFLMPIVYLPGAVPPQFQFILWLNPFTYMIYVYHDILYFGRIEHPGSWVVFGICSIFAFTLGYRLFRRVRPHFADHL